MSALITAMCGAPTRHCVSAQHSVAWGLMHLIVLLAMANTHRSSIRNGVSSGWRDKQWIWTEVVWRPRPVLPCRLRRS